MKNKKFILSIVTLCMALTFTHPSFAAETKGKVVEVEGAKVKIKYRSDFAPRVGDKVQIGDELGGMFIPVEGDWKIVKVTRDFAWAESKDPDTGTPDPGYLAIIQSENPQ